MAEVDAELQGRLDRLIADEHPKARACIDDMAHLVAACCTRRAAKTRSWIRKMLRVAAGVPHARVVYINETMPECERIAWRGNGRDGLLTLNEKYQLGGAPHGSKHQLYFPQNDGLIE